MNGNKKKKPNVTNASNTTIYFLIRRIRVGARLMDSC